MSCLALTRRTALLLAGGLLAFAAAAQDYPRTIVRKGNIKAE